MSVEFGILGPLEVRAEGRPVALAGSRPRALLGCLLLHPNEPVSADELAVALWGEEAPARSTKTVHVHVSRLRKALGDPDALTTTPAGYRLRVRPEQLDAERFRRLVDDGRRALAADEPEHAGALLRQALALWRGPPLAELAFAPFAQGAIAALQEERLVALETRLEADLRAGRHAELVPELQRLVAEHPLRERLHGRLMLALYRAGRQADALEAYRHARATLVEELGIEPGIELRELERAVLTQDPDLAAPAASGAEPAAAPLVLIPAAPTPTVGREADVAYLCAAVRDPDTRLTTVVGPGGVGKTRLAAEAARAIGHEFRHGARFVSLAAVGADEHVASTICRELDVPLVAGEPVDRALVGHLRDEELLLVLDNFEHVLEEPPLGHRGRPSRCSSPSRRRVIPGSRRPIATSRPWWRSAADWTGCRSRSSWRPVASTCCRRPSSPGGCATASTRSAPARVTRPRASARSRRRSSGAGRCWRRTNDAPSPVSPYSPAARRCTPPRR